MLTAIALSRGLPMSVFLAVFVPKGMHAMRLVYRPESFVRGRATSGISMMGLLVVMFFYRRRLF